MGSGVWGGGEEGTLTTRAGAAIPGAGVADAAAGGRKRRTRPASPAGSPRGGPSAAAGAAAGSGRRRGSAAPPGPAPSRRASAPRASRAGRGCNWPWPRRRRTRPRRPRRRRPRARRAPAGCWTLPSRGALGGGLRPLGRTGGRRGRRGGRPGCAVQRRGGSAALGKMPQCSRPRAAAEHAGTGLTLASRRGRSLGCVRRPAGWRTPRHNGRAAGLSGVGVSGSAHCQALRSATVGQAGLLHPKEPECCRALPERSRAWPNSAEPCRSSNEPCPSPPGVLPNSAEPCRSPVELCRAPPNSTDALWSSTQPRQALIEQHLSRSIGSWALALLRAEVFRGCRRHVQK